MKKGFTLVELLVVISIIGVLSSVVFATLSSSRAKARAAAALQTFGSINAALRVCLSSGLALNYPTETQDGGLGLLCPTGSSYVKLPNTWIYCDNGPNNPQSAVNCGNDISQQPNVGVDYSFVVESPADTTKIVCTQDGCTKSADSD